MKKRLHVLMALGLALGMIAGVLGTPSTLSSVPGHSVTTAYAEEPPDSIQCELTGYFTLPGTDICLPIAGSLFFPGVANYDHRVQLDPRSDTDLGPVRGIVNLQNLEETEAEIDIYVGQADGGWSLTDGYTVPAGGAITIGSEDILGDQEVAPVVAVGWKDRGEPDPDGGLEARCIVMIGGQPVDVTESVASLPGDPLENCIEFAEALGDQVDRDELGLPIAVIQWFPAWMLEDPPEPASIDGVYKQATGPALEDGKTTPDHSMVDGYGAFDFGDIFSWHGGYVVPIVQTNNGWNTILQAVSFARVGDSIRYTIEIFEAFDESGQSAAEIEGEVRSGEVESHNLLEHPDIDDGFIGSAVIRSDAPMGVVAERVKVEADMLIMTTSTAISEDEGPSVAPLVYLDFHNWSTGISISNPSDTETLWVTMESDVTATAYYEEITVPPLGMGFVHSPGTAEQSGGVFGVIVDGSGPLVAEIDQVKYADGDPGSAMSYRTIPFADLATDGDRLAQPLFQKGDPETGLGDTSGIQFFNASPDAEATLDIWIFDENGLRVPPTQDEPISQTLMPHQGYTFYAFDLPELPPGFNGSVQVDVSGDGLVGAVGNNVNYSVQGDGAFSSPLGLVPAPADASVPTDFIATPVSDVNPLGSTHEIVVIVYDQFGNRYWGASVYAIVDQSTAGNQGRFLNPGFANTNRNGEARLSYTSNNVGHDVIVIRVDGIAESKTVEKHWNPPLQTFASVLLEHASGAVVDGDGVAYIEAGEPHTVIATVTNQIGIPLADVDVHFSISGGNDNAATTAYVHSPAASPSPGQHGPTGTTDLQGKVALTYTSASTGTDTITAEVGVSGSASVASVWVNEIALTLDPPSAENPAGTDHTVTAKATADGAPLVEIRVIFEVEGTNAGAPGTTDPDADGDNTGATDADGEVTFTYTDTETVGISCDQIRAWFLGVDINKYNDIALKCWEDVSP